MDGSQTKEELKQLDTEVEKEHGQDSATTVDLNTILKVRTIKPIDFQLPEDIVGD